MYRYKNLIIAIFVFTLIGCANDKNENLITKPEKIPELKVLFTNALNYYNQAVSIPIFYNLTKSNQKKVINSIKKLVTKKNSSVI